jgi:hypothetical protein
MRWQPPSLPVWYGLWVMGCVGCEALVALWIWVAAGRQAVLLGCCGGCLGGGLGDIARSCLACRCALARKSTDAAINNNQPISVSIDRGKSVVPACVHSNGAAAAAAAARKIFASAWMSFLPECGRGVGWALLEPTSRRPPRGVLSTSLEEKPRRATTRRHHHTSHPTSIDRIERCVVLGWVCAQLRVHDSNRSLTGSVRCAGALHCIPRLIREPATTYTTTAAYTHNTPTGSIKKDRSSEGLEGGRPLAASTSRPRKRCAYC